MSRVKLHEMETKKINFSLLENTISILSRRREETMSLDTWHAIISKITDRLLFSRELRDLAVSSLGNERGRTTGCWTAWRVGCHFDAVDIYIYRHVYVDVMHISAKTALKGPWKASDPFLFFLLLSHRHFFPLYCRGLYCLGRFRSFTFPEVERRSRESILASKRLTRDVAERS